MEAGILQNRLPENYAANLIKLFDTHVDNQPDKIAYTFIQSGLLREKSITYAELQHACGKVAAWLTDQGYRHKKIMLCYENGLDFIITFLGCLYAQATAVIFPYLKNEKPESLRPKVIAACALAQVELTIANQQTLDELKIHKHCAIEFIFANAESRFENYTYANDLATHILFTSGTTSPPKMVLFNHGMLAYNLYYTGSTWAVDAKSKHLNWGFAFHSAGLMVGYLLSIYHGGACLQIEAGDFQQNPGIFPALISQYNITHTSSANFTYEHLLKFPVNPSENFDLSSWQVAMVGGDPLQVATLIDFYRRYAQHGFAFRSFQTAYGMTEATGLISTGETLPTPAMVLLDLHEAKFKRVVISQSSRLTADNNIPFDFDRGNKLVLGCGKASCGTQILILNEAQQMVEGIGDIYFHSPSLALGYLQADGQLDYLAENCIIHAGKKYFATGDLGFLYQNELYILGRSREIIKVNNAIYFPLFIELIVSYTIPELKPGTQVAVMNAGDVILIQELSIIDYDKMAELEAKIKFHIERVYNLQIDSVYFIQMNTLPKLPSSGKTQRTLCLQHLLSSKLQLVETQCLN